MITKIIHYCWFGKNEISEDIKFFIDTWKKYCPDYEIRQWNEENFDVNQNLYCREAYEAKKWAFVSDYVRLKVLYDYGGIYMDTDVEVCKSFDDLLEYNAWSGFESDSKIPTGTLAASKNNTWIKYLLTYYDNKKFKRGHNTYDLTTNVETITRMTKEKYNIKLNNTFQIFDSNNILFPFEYFCAKNYVDGKINKTDKTYTIHHFKGSWLTEKDKKEQEIYRHYYNKYINKYGNNKVIKIISRILAIYKVKGVTSIFYRIKDRINKAI